MIPWWLKMPLPIDFMIELADSLLSAADSSTRAGLVAAAVVEAVGDSACVVHRLISIEDVPSLSVIGLAGPVTLEGSAFSEGSRLLEILSEGETGSILYSGADIQREDWAHLNVSRTVASLGYIALLSQETLTGMLEVLTFSQPMDEADLDALQPIARLAATALVGAEDQERQRQNLLDSVHRMSQLYDLEKSLNATLELDGLIGLVPRKALAMLPCQAVHLWLFENDVLRLMASSGSDATVEVGTSQAAGEGYVADMAEEGDPLLIADAADERLIPRNAGLSDDSLALSITTALLVPLMQGEAEIGVLEAVNKSGDAPFDDDDLFFFSAMSETVSNALKNASLMNAERRLEILQALVHVSAEITSTLRLDRLLKIIVNSPQNVLPYERCSIALDHRGTLQLKAVSGMANIPMGDALVDRLLELVRWLSPQSSTFHLRCTGDATQDSELPDEVARHFEATGYGALYSLPLADDQGRVGLLLYEGADPEFLDLPHTEMIKILGGQATVAIRNALLYREVPLISLLEPLLQKKQALLRSSRSRKVTYAAILAAAVLFLVLCPLPMRISGLAVIAPQHVVTIAAPVDGNVAAVFAKEGQRVAAGELLGTMNDWQWRSDVASAEAKYRAAEMATQASLASGSAAAGADRAQAEFLQSEAMRARSRVESAQLRSPIAGVIATPALGNLAGQHLSAGDNFAQVLDLSSAVVNIQVTQSDVALVHAGQSATVKLDSYPQRSWHGEIDVVSPQAQATESDRIFAARVPLPNADATLRAGMTGKAKIFVGYSPAGYVLLRAPAMWLWQTLWNWIGW
jgi:RND family efflux transporter MFP subunit